MSARMRDLLSDGFDQLRLEPIAKRIRAVRAGGTVMDSTQAVLVEEPLHDAARVRGLIAFFDERIDVTLDGRRRERPVTPWSP